MYLKALEIVSSLLSGCQDLYLAMFFLSDIGFLFGWCFVEGAY